ncbi:hypothetical protein FACS1894124_3070 [Spirochaetia bacterium]|nr:hypothetical protein FACS1894124_3070 [Spirochaetia bacterium]
MTVLRRNLTLAAVSAAILIAFVFAGCPAEMASVIPLPEEGTIVVQPPEVGKEKPATGIHFVGDTDRLVFNGQESATLEAAVTPADATTRTVYWSSSNPAVVTVRSVSTAVVPMGTVVPTGLGEAKVYAQVSDGKGDYYTATCLISVLIVPEAGIVIEGEEIDQYNQYKRLSISSIGEDKYISARVLYGTGPVTWTISDKADPVVLLNNGSWDSPPSSDNEETVTVTGRKVGTAYLTATSAEGKTDTITVTVSAIAVDTIKITKPNEDPVTSLTINRDTTQSVKAKLTPAETTYTVVKWEIVDGKEIVDLSTDTTTDGSDLVTITAKTAGTAHIRATSEDGKTADCAIRVPPKYPSFTLSVTPDATYSSMGEPNFGLDWEDAPDGMTNAELFDKFDAAYTAWEEFEREFTPRPFYDKDGDGKSPILSGGAMGSSPFEVFELNSQGNYRLDNRNPNSEGSIVIHRYWPKLDPETGNSLPQTRDDWVNNYESLRIEAFKEAEGKVTATLKEIKDSPLWQEGGGPLYLLYASMERFIPTTLPETDWEQQTGFNLSTPTGARTDVSINPEFGHLYEYYLGYVPKNTDEDYFEGAGLFAFPN